MINIQILFEMSKHYEVVGDENLKKMNNFRKFSPLLFINESPSFLTANIELGYTWLTIRF